MKQILKTFAVVGVILLTALMAAGSCDKTPAANKSNNNNNNSGDVVDGSTKLPEVNAANIKIENLDATIAKINTASNAIYLKADAFPTKGTGSDKLNYGSTVDNPLSDLKNGYIKTHSTFRGQRTFDIKYDGAIGGIIMLMSRKGAEITFGEIQPKLPVNGNVPADSKVYPGGRDGVYAVATADAMHYTYDKGLNIISGLLDNFSYAAGVRPGVWCYAVAPEITDIITVTDLNAIGSKKLLGGHTAKCGVTSLYGDGNYDGLGASGKATAWLTHADATVKEIKVSAIALKTDGSTVSNILKSVGTTDTERFNAIKGGPDNAAIKKLYDANKANFAVKNFTIKIVSDADF